MHSAKELSILYYLNYEMREKWHQSNINLFMEIYRLTSSTWEACDTIHIKIELKPWPVWLSRLSTGLRTKGSPVQFPGRAYAWVAGQVP